MFMKKMFKRLTATLLCIALLVLSSIVPSYAEDTTIPENPVNEDKCTLATWAYSDETTEVFYIPISDSVTRSIYNLEVSLTGDTDTRTVSATVSNTAALGFSTIDIEIALYSERSSTVLRDVAYDDDLNLFESLTVKHTGVTQSAKYYDVGVE